jgi:hypothetical protein
MTSLTTLKRANTACSGLGGGPCKNGGVQANAFFRFISWFSHQAANASRWAADDIFEQEIEMTRNMSVVLYTVVMIAVVASIDLLFFKNRFW